MSNNKLLGEIPNSLDGCSSLERLYLESNKFEGTIPQSLINIRGLEKLDLSHKNLSGQIPAFFSELRSLRNLNLSYNKFDGQVTKEGIFANASAISVYGNEKLCDGIPELVLPLCSKHVSRNHFRPKVVIVITISGAVLFFFYLTSFVLYYIMKSSKRQPTSSSIELQLGLSYLEILKSTNNFSEENLIGFGSFGSVYKGILSSDGQIVAIKVLKVDQRGALKSFDDECNALRRIRHCNILRVITVCSSIDFEGNDFKCLVFEFMPNGSLDKWLHPTVDEQLAGIKKMNLIQRLSIAIDVAFAFDYLHHYCQTTIVHCDLKPSNILLDEDMTVHVGDFGLARFLFETSNNAFQNQTMSVGLRGSIGYIPPEYMCGQVSMLGDIYSYGILLLEMFTGKRPTDEMFKDDFSIYKFVFIAFPNHVMDVVDPSLLFEEENEDGIEESIIDIESGINNKKLLEECLVSVLRVGLLCSKTSPEERMAMNDVVNSLKAMRNSFLKSKDTNRQRRR
ncbi:LOW QUALITY PROTEIN: probable LRR receptor-like serine/threonine-protein kinase At3g47570 [Pistacia vera]|uniref:LOW QUALITY PROTEIN: probable LRR receptor-like serine/threonine-protein kinase At3g47570 n=1 Tax=Pistacia vera TaxID=55513 RepID=UPI001263545E|nr:LOW QUALITY PROTEIN: probable LRR receptor-like serine/threonine-protein kinase At3g47570 [Pistacia vera]